MVYISLIVDQTLANLTDALLKSFTGCLDSHANNYSLLVVVLVFLGLFPSFFGYLGHFVSSPVPSFAGNSFIKSFMASLDFRALHVFPLVFVVFVLRSGFTHILDCRLHDAFDMFRVISLLKRFMTCLDFRVIDVFPLAVAVFV